MIGIQGEDCNPANKLKILNAILVKLRDIKPLLDFVFFDIAENEKQIVDLETVKEQGGESAILFDFQTRNHKDDELRKLLELTRGQTLTTLKNMLLAANSFKKR